MAFLHANNTVIQRFTAKIHQLLAKIHPILSKHIHLMPNLHIDFSILPKIQSFYFFNVIIVGFMKVNDLQTFYWNSGGVGLLYKKCQNLA